PTHSGCRPFGVEHPAPTVMQRVVSPVLHSYVKAPSGPHTCTVAPASTVGLEGVIAHGGGVVLTPTLAVQVVVQPFDWNVTVTVLFPPWLQVASGVSPPD